MKLLTSQEKADFVNTVRILNVNVEKIVDREKKLKDLEQGLRTPGKGFFPTYFKWFGQLWAVGYLGYIPTP